jgi:DNA-binding transcriptional ArsR family regulator
MKSKNAVRMLAALAQEHRLAIYRLLVKRGPDGCAAGDIAARMAIPAPTLSFHLKALAHAELIDMRRVGRFLYYSANFPGINELVAFLTENCCGLGDAGRIDVCAPPVPRAGVARVRRRA